MLIIIRDPKPSKINSIMKWWSRCISVAIAKTASRNVAFKVAKMREAIMEDQDEFLMRSAECADVDVHTNNRAHCFSDVKLLSLDYLIVLVVVFTYWLIND